MNMMGAEYSPNYSGFSGYPIGSIYPGMGSGVTQTDETIPEPSEQAQYTNGEERDTVAVDRGAGRNILLIILIALVLIAVLGR